MRLYTIQSLEVLEVLTTYGVYFPQFDKCFYLQDIGDKLAFERPYKWMLEQYNRIKSNEISSPLVWWYTDLEEAQECFKRTKNTKQVLLRADVDDKDILFHDADEWEVGPLNNLSLGFKGHHIWMSNDWTNKDEEISDKLDILYKANQKAKEETWKEVFNITKNTERIHANTSCIFRSYLQK